jgi:hypothetical protein
MDLKKHMIDSLPQHSWLPQSAAFDAHPRGRAVEGKRTKCDAKEAEWHEHGEPIQWELEISVPQKK